MNAYEAFLADLDEAIRRAGSALKLAEALGITPSAITRWRNRERIPMLDKIQPVYDYLGKEFGAASPRAKTVTQAPDSAALRRRVEQLEREVYQKEGEIRALERQLSRLAPAPGGKEGCSVSPWKASGN